MTRERQGSTARAVVTRYAPVAVAVAIVVGVVVLVSGGGDDEATTTPSSSKLPLTFDEAKAQGKQIDFGPTCDPATGRLAIPLSYAPPCVEPWKGGDNGGATAAGVTADEIVIAVYQAQPDALQQVFFEQSGSDESLDTELVTNQQYADFFSSYYETYGRRIRLVPIKASGPPDDDVTAKADAIKVATEIKAFASWGGPGQTHAYADELAARGVLCLGDCILAQPESFIASRAPHIWPTLASPEQAARHWAAFVGRQLAGKNAEHAGDESFRDKKRRFGIVRYDDETGTFDRSFATFEKLLGNEGVKIAADVPYQYDLERAAETSRAVLAALKEANVTSVIIAGDPIFPTVLSKEATAQDYFPEWILMGYAFSDTAIFGRLADQEQWSHAFGVSLLPTRQRDNVDELANVLVWHSGQPPAAKTFRVLVQAPLLFFTGVHLAGPNLTPETFEQGLFRYPSSETTVAPYLHVSWGKHGIWPFVDHTAGDDAVVIYWDPTATGPDEVGNEGTGMWRYALGGRRYLPDDWPTRDVGLYDDASSVVILDQLPPDARPPDYPSPAGA